MEGVAETIVEKVKEMVYAGRFEFETLKQLLFNQMNIRQRETVPAKLDLVLMMRNNVVLEISLADSALLQVQQMPI